MLHLKENMDASLFKVDFNKCLYLYFDYVEPWLEPHGSTQLKET